MKFEELKVRQKSRLLVKTLYSIFWLNKDYSFKDQICRAWISIMNNIAEWNDRNTNTQFCHFLNIAIGSANEVRSMLYVALDLWYITSDLFEELLDQLFEVCGMLAKFRKILFLKNAPI